MCRSNDFHNFRPMDRDHLRIRAFFIRFTGLVNAQNPLPESLTLLYLPRINENVLEIDGSKIRPDSSGFVTLHRSVAATAAEEGEVLFGSRERVRASEGVRFEVYLGEEKVLKGIFRKDEGQEWKLECKCALESEMGGAAEVCVAAEGGAALVERVEMVLRRRRRRNRRGFKGLEEIPEDREGETESDGCCCSCGESECGSDGGDLNYGCNGYVGVEEEMDMEGVRRAIDVGFWVVCLGAGFLVSKACARSLRRIRML